MWPAWNLTIDATALLVILGIAWRINVVLGRMWNVLKDYPPHRHISPTQLIYPVGMEPSEPRELETHKAARA